MCGGYDGVRVINGSVGVGVVGINGFTEDYGTSPPNWSLMLAPTFITINFLAHDSAHSRIRTITLLWYDEVEELNMHCISEKRELIQLLETPTMKNYNYNLTFITN